jgi:hypothetical protein
MDMEHNGKTNLDKIRAALENTISDPEYQKYLDVIENKDGSISIKAKSILFAKIKVAKNSSYVEVKPEYEKSFPNHKAERASDHWCRIPINGIDEALSLSEPLSVVYMKVLSGLGGETFGCCHRYVECSDALRCTNPDFMASLACMYKKNLDAGRVFYGKNKNI